MTVETEQQPEQSEPTQTMASQEDPESDQSVKAPEPEPNAITEVLAAAVAEVSGQDRPGQTAMAQAVREALSNEQHLLVQAGTGTGKSLGYLVPSILNHDRVVVATATLSLQHQLIERDVPALQRALRKVKRVPPKVAVLKGRSNYACLRKVRDGVAEQDSLFDDDIGKLGAEVLALREWTESESETRGTGERENAPSHTDTSWRQVSVSARECVGASRCPFGVECFAELAREEANSASLVITNHALLAIDAIDGVPMLPGYDAVVIDEAHELVSRVTQAATDELDPTGIDRAAKRARPHLDDEGSADDLADAADSLRDVLARCEPGTIAPGNDTILAVLRLVHDAARACISAFAKPDKQHVDPEAHAAKTSVDDVRQVAERMASMSEYDVLWFVDSPYDFGLRVAPINVASILSTKLFAEKTAVLTSATLTLGGSFDPVARSLGLMFDDHAWQGLDVGSPFDYPKQGILYAARHLPAPGRGDLGEERLSEIAELIEAAGGRTLGLFSSRRAAEQAAEEMRKRLPDIEVLCQGDAHLSELTARFIKSERTCLFGSLSLWQGLDVPGSSCTLVLIDRIPFPRPDDPVMSARQRLIEKHGGNGFMSVAAHNAALLLAQGAGRLIRSHADKGVVAILDSRIVTARYGSFLVNSLPPMHRTVDPDAVRASLRRLDHMSASR